MRITLWHRDTEEDVRIGETQIDSIPPVGLIIVYMNAWRVVAVQAITPQPGSMIAKRLKSGEETQAAVYDVFVERSEGLFR